ncbi:MAG TPA: hypothetical protein DCZ94_10650 [Lentisphaeria bacterium]|nr:MAG: hypothetical protein A2X48_06525 [Lentisphaerae bacterium GWF2_49_21]HBC87404.1 hypothetical protein [Lentisphaeria bacterium]
MDQNLEKDNFVTCGRCNARNSFGNYECISCREVLEYGDTDEPYIDAESTPKSEPALRINWYRKSLFYIPPFILLLIMLTFYLYYAADLLLILTIILFFPWATYCTVDIYTDSKRMEETRKLDVPKRE